MTEWREQGNPSDVVRVTFTVQRWQVMAARDAMGEQAESVREDNDPGLNKWADAVDEVCNAMCDGVYTVDSVPPPIGTRWSWRHMGYVPTN